MLPEKLLSQLLKDEFDVKPSDLRAAIAKAEKLGKNLEQYLIDEGTIDELELYNKASKSLNVPLIELKGKEIKKEILNLVPPTIAQAHQIIAFDKNTTEIKLATLDPLDIQIIEFLHRKTGLTPKVYLATPSDLKDALHRYHADLEGDIAITQLTDGAEAQAGDLKKAAQELPIVNIVNSILEHAVFEGASDIHIEPSEKEVNIRYRVDGMLRPVMTLPKTVKDGITARIKIMANLKIDEHMQPQDGRFKIQIQEEKLSFRVSIIPVYDGEKVVMRLLHEGQKSLTLEQLGFLPEQKELVEKAIKKPHGMILVTGPTGSGKTTTLYSILGLLNQPNVNISTIEDPIEYHINGINQSQINPKVGFTFASGLRAFLRQDPNIIMVGEIRDAETAEIAIHAAMTGHLVLSTLHTNDAPTTLPRLIDMGIPPFLIAFTANIIVAQRLVRKICEHCKKEIKLTKSIADDLAKFADIKKINSAIFYHGEGCHRCNNSGYKGRVGIYEVMEVNEKISDQINNRANADVIKKIAREQGMSTMFEDGLAKAQQGITTIEEILRVTKE